MTKHKAAGTFAEFKKAVFEYYALNGRDFPWRNNLDPWGVLVSEFMLQQTQTARVVPYWEKWLSLWPNPATLAAAPLQDALREWSGLGYNRRARRLWECAKALASNHGGKVPGVPEELVKLPGIGAYTAGAVSCFAFNYPSLFIETNIRAVFIHFFFQGRAGINDGEILPLLEQSLDRDNPRAWYWALMDYGAALKKVTANPNRKSAHYARQSRFKGSLREVRGAIVRKLSGGGRQGADALFSALKKELAGLEKELFYRAVGGLEKDMMVAEEEGTYRVWGG